MKSTLNNVFAAMIVVTITGTLFAQDPVKLSPQMYTVLLDNEHVRVYEFRCKPGEKEPVHSHPAFVVYNLSSTKARSFPKDGEPEEFDTKLGTADWVEATTHSFECLGPGEHRSLIIEMKGHAKHMATMTTPDRAADEAAIRAFINRATEINRKGDAAAWAGMFAEGGIFMPQDQPEVMSRQALLAYVQGYWDKFDSNITITPVEIEVFGDWAFARTTVQGTNTPKGGGDPVKVDFKEIAVYRRQSDGAWKLWRLIGNSN